MDKNRVVNEIKGGGSLSVQKNKIIEKENPVDTLGKTYLFFIDTGQTVRFKGQTPKYFNVGHKIVLDKFKLDGGEVSGIYMVEDISHSISHLPKILPSTYITLVKHRDI